MSALDHLKNADFDIARTKITEGEGIRDLVHDHKFDLTRSEALVGATVGALFAFIVVLAMGLLASITAGEDLFRIMTLIIIFSILLCAGFGAYYAIFHKAMNRESWPNAYSAPAARAFSLSNAHAPGDTGPPPALSSSQQP